MDVTHYTHLYKEEATAACMDVVHYLALKFIREVLAAAGITATAGIGTNLYLAKVAMDVVAKHVEADTLSTSQSPLLLYTLRCWPPRRPHNCREQYLSRGP